GERPLARGDRDRRARDLQRPRCQGGDARAAAQVLSPGPRPSRGVVPGRPGDPRPEQVSPPGPAEPGLAASRRLPHDLLPQRLDLLRRGRANGALKPPGAALAPGWLARDRQRRDPPRRAFLAPQALTVDL